ncbi:hypothetical protein [Polaromonas sp. A23]|uniref:hypothetical protein n=1 Tax=Polaromonas sp. A23 TaxID=1944133 RepID=UPI0009CFFD91|nr:hypothetical protein B0B52_16825 [Polaromonas sp. A23]
MHSAPSVVYPLGRSFVQGLTLLGFWLAGALVLGFWWAITPGAGWRLWFTLTVLLGSGMAAAWRWKNSPAGQLCWDGQVWRWQSQAYLAGMPGRQLTVALDLQRTMLLRLENQDHTPLWLWAARSAMPERWLDLRRAAHSAQRVLIAPSSPGDRAAAVDAADDLTELPLPRPGS